MILKLGVDTSAVVDVSGYVESGFRINTSPIFEDEFTAVDGTDYKALKGYKVKIAASLSCVPASVMNAILAACAGDKVKVQYAYGATGQSASAREAYFFAPAISAEMVTEGDTTAYGEFWDVSIDMESVTLDCL